MIIGVEGLEVKLFPSENGDGLWVIETDQGAGRVDRAGLERVFGMLRSYALFYMRQGIPASPPPVSRSAFYSLLDRSRTPLAVA